MLPKLAEPLLDDFAAGRIPLLYCYGGAVWKVASGGFSKIRRTGGRGVWVMS